MGVVKSLAHHREVYQANWCRKTGATRHTSRAVRMARQRPAYVAPRSGGLVTGEKWEVCLLPHVHYKRDKRDIGDKRDNLKNFFSTPAAQPLGHLVSRFYPTSGFAGHLPPGSAS